MEQQRPFVISLFPALRCLTDIHYGRIHPDLPCLVIECLVIECLVIECLATLVIECLVIECLVVECLVIERHCMYNWS